MKKINFINKNKNIPQILYFFYNHPCQLLTPIWLVPFFIGPGYLYTLAFPAFHFFIMIERYRATVLAEKYEQEGRKFHIKTALLIVLIWDFKLINNYIENKYQFQRVILMKIEHKNVIN